MTSDTTTCPVCEARASQTGQEHTDDGERYRCYRCEVCELVFWSPRVIRPDFYAEEHVGTYERRHRGESFLRDRHHTFFERPRSGRLLDVGCGEGSFLAEAAHRGLDPWGIELDQGSVLVARGRLGDQTGDRIIHGLFVDADGGLNPEIARLGRFDWVTAFEVLEHQPDPVAFLKGTAAMLPPGGVVCGSVPNRERAFAGRSRQGNVGDYPPHHFLWFSVPALEATLRAAGFDRVEVRPIRARDPVNFATYLATAALGAFRVRPGVRAAQGGGGARPPSRRASRTRRALRLLKSLPFLPMAVAINQVAPRYAHSLYFEAARS